MDNSERAPEVPRLLRRPVWWWAITGTLTLVCVVSLLARAWLNIEQARLLRQNGWDILKLPKANMDNVGVTSLVTDPNGHLWVGTHTGVHTFDGHQWQSYLASRSVWASHKLAADNAGGIWVASYTGLHVIKDGQAHNVSTENLTSSLLATDKNGQVWIGDASHYGIAPVANQGIGKSLPDAGANTDLSVLALIITFDPDGRMWLGTYGGVSVYDGHQWQSHTPMAELSVSAIAFDPQGKVWVSGHIPSLTAPVPSFLVEYDSGKWTSHRVPLPSPEEATPFTPVAISELAFDTQGRLWAAFRTSDFRDSKLNFGLGMYNGENWTFYETADAINPLSSTENTSGCHTLLVDEFDRLWIGAGSSVVSYDLQTALPAPDPVPDTVLNGLRTSRQLTWSSGVLATAIGAIAAWATFLNSERGHNWAQQLQTRVEKMPEFARTTSILGYILSTLVGGACFCAWFLLLRPLTDQQGIEALNRMLACLGPIYVVFGAGSGLVFRFGIMIAHKRRTPNQLVLGLLIIVLSLLLWVIFGVLSVFALAIALD